MAFREVTKHLNAFYKMAREGKIPALKIEFNKDNKAIFRVPYDQESSKKTEICTHLIKTSFAKMKIHCIH